MKASAKRLTFLIVCILPAVACLSMSILAQDGGKQASRQGMPQRELAVSGAALPQVQSPVLTVDGKESPDVYLQSLDIQVEVTGSIASTRHTMIFKNRTNRIMEGMLTFPLSDGRSVTYYALDINGKMREAVPVEKARGTQVFEEIERRRVDPGLLERVEGNNFRTRIYPIPADGTRTVSIGYEEELAFETASPGIDTSLSAINTFLRYNLPLDYPEPLENFSVKATVLRGGQKPVVPESEAALHFDAAGENYVATYARENYRPACALEFLLPAPVDIPKVLMQPAQGNYYFLASVAPGLEARKKQWGDTLAIIWDVSLSGSQRDIKRELEALNIIFAGKRDAVAHLYYLNNRLRKINSKRGNKEITGQARNDEIDTRHSRESWNLQDGGYEIMNGNWDELKNTLNAAVFDGGTDFSQIDLKNIAGNEILFFSDGISTLGDADFLNKVNLKTCRPIHCAVSSAKADYGAMRLIALKTKGKFININELSREKLKGELLNETPLFLGAEHGKIIREVYPGVATPVYGNFSVAGISGAGNAEMTLLFGFGNSVEKRLKVLLNAKSAADNWNAHKIWAQKKIAELDLDYEKNKAELTGIGRQFGIVTRGTSLIVLETVSDYKFYGIKLPPDLQGNYQAKGATDTGWSVEGLMSSLKRNGGAGSSGGAGGGSFDKGGLAADIDKMLQSLSGPKPGDGHGAGRKGVAGIGQKSGTGGWDGAIDDLLRGLRGGGSGGLELKKKEGELRVSSPDFLRGGSLSGGRSRASIQRVIMENMGAFREAYHKRSREKPGVGGAITVEFSINRYGEVISAYIVESTMDDAVFERTVVNKVKKLRFEESYGGGDAAHRFVFTEGYGWGPKAERALEERERRIEAQKARETAERERWARIVRERKEKEKARLELEKLRKRVIGDNILREAVEAAGKIRRWRNTDFTRPEPKYPEPDKRYNAEGADSRRCFKEKVYFKDTTGNMEEDYQLYLKIREEHAASPAFYFDMANWFYTRGDRETALRVLTSIADLELENAVNYRMLGYRLKEYGEYAQEKYVCGKVLQWRPLEIQNHLDYALALADNGEAQAALDSLCSMLKRPFPENLRHSFPYRNAIGEVAVTELNRLIVKNPRLNTSRVDKRLLTNVATDIRVVVRWNTDETNVNLSVRDPNGEWTRYFRDNNWGDCEHMSDDIRNGYGPEQFLLKKAKKGKYLICVNYIADIRPTVDLTTVAVDIYRKYAGRAEERQTVSRRMLRDAEPVNRDWASHNYWSEDRVCVVAEVIID